MRVFVAKTVALVSTDVAASAYPEYSAGTGYTVGYNVKVSFEADGTTPRFPVEEYQASGATTGNYPPTNLDKWTPMGADGLAVCNRDACLDGYINTKTSKTGSMQYVLDVSGTNGVGLFNLTAKTVNLSLEYDSSVRATGEESIIIYPEQNLWSYFNNDIEFSKSLLWTYPRFSSAELTIDISYYTSENAECGMVVAGLEKYIGRTRYGAKVGLRDYGLPEADDIGRVSLVPGSNYSRTRSVELWIDREDFELMEQRLIDIRETLCIFDCNNPGTYEKTLIIYGYYRDFYMTLDGPKECKCVLEIEGII